MFRKPSHLRDGIDIGLVASEGLSGLATSNVPELGAGVACSRDKGVVVRSKRQAVQRNVSFVQVR
jgi:hypothetical protein